MNARPPCTLLARCGPVRLTTCSVHDAVHLSVGPVTLHLSPDTVLALGIACQDASHRLAVLRRSHALQALAPQVDEV